MKTKLFKNDDAKFDSPIAMIAFFSISLVFSSVVISWMLLNAYGIAFMPVKFPDFKLEGVNDLTQNASTEGITFIGDAWTYSSGTGRISTAVDSYILFDNAGSPNAGAHTNTYRINNPNQEDYSIVLSYSTVRNQEVIVSYDGFHVMEGTLGFENERYFYPFEGANQITQTTIKTDFDITTDEAELKFYMDGNLVFDLPSNIGFNIQIEPFIKAYYGGVGSKNNIGLSVSNFATTDNSKISATAEIIESISMWALALITLMAWNIDPTYLPWELNLLLIKSQVFCIGLGLFFWARGSS